jgi:NAD(P)-dependent dehydrogenase (short-subunit alcohol dehydrogenase family)
MSSPQIILITGANQGLGYETALQISKLPGYHILLGARDPVKGAAAVERLAFQGGLSEVSLLIINVDSDESIYAAKMEVEQRFGKLDVLIVSHSSALDVCVLSPYAPQNNAAIHLDFVPGLSTRGLLQDTFETNVYGVAVTTAAFLPLLEKTPLPRIVNVSSTVGSLERMSMTGKPWSHKQWMVKSSFSSPRASGSLQATGLQLGEKRRQRVHCIFCADASRQTFSRHLARSRWVTLSRRNRRSRCGTEGQSYRAQQHEPQRRVCAIIRILDYALMRLIPGHDVTGQDPSIGAAGIVRVAVAGPDSGFNTGDFRDQHGRIVPW